MDNQNNQNNNLNSSLNTPDSNTQPAMNQGQSTPINNVDSLNQNQTLNNNTNTNQPQQQISQPLDLNVSSQTNNDTQVSGDGKRVNKLMYVLLMFFFAPFGVGRFLRGQIGLGIAMLLLSWLTLFIWPFVEFIISLIKLGKYPGDDFIFDEKGNWIK